MKHKKHIFALTVIYLSIVGLHYGGIKNFVKIKIKRFQMFPNVSKIIEIILYVNVEKNIKHDLDFINIRKNVVLMKIEDRK